MLMTEYYNIEVIKTQTHFKVTYRDNKFRKLEHLRGDLNDAMLKQLGRIIPRTTTDFKAFTDTYKETVKYIQLETEKSQYSEFLTAWNVFYEDYYQLPPKFTGAEGKALKSIMTHLTRIGKTESEALALWQIILQKWHTLNEFHQANADLKYINSKLNIIINAIKQQSNTYTAGTNSSVEL